MVEFVKNVIEEYKTPSFLGDFSSDRRVKTLTLCNDKKIDSWHFVEMSESVRFSPPSQSETIEKLKEVSQKIDEINAVVDRFGIDNIELISFMKI